MDECSVLCHHSTKCSVTVSTESIDSLVDVSNVDETAEVGKFPKPSMSVFSTQQLIAGLLCFYD